MPWRTTRNVPWPKPPEQVISAPAWGCVGGRIKKSEIGARFVIIVWDGWRVGVVERRRESAKWEPRKRVWGSSEMSVEGILD
jgi:hypothetical protein